MQSAFNTARLSLNLISADDADFISELVNTNGWLQFIGDRNVHSKDDALQYISKIINTNNLYYWVVKIKTSAEPIGIISLLKRNYLEHFDIGFAFLPSYHGKGYALEATSIILEYAVKNFDDKIILATTIPSNTSSIKLIKKLGMQFEKQMQFENTIIHIYSNKPK